MSAAAALTWFARHEFRLAWREWLGMMTAGRRFRKRAAIVGLLVFAAILHLPAYAVVGRFANLQPPLDKPTLIVITTSIFLAWALMLSQAIESVTRVFYARADLDLIMSSPVAMNNVFCGPHRGDRVVGHRDGAAAVDALRRRSRDRRRRALVLGLWRRDHDRPFGGGRGGGDHDRAVSHHRCHAGPGWSRKSSRRSSARAS